MMKKGIIVIFVMIILASAGIAQTGTPIDAGTPAGAGDKNLQSNDIKLRSIELERIKREADKNAVVRRDDGVELKFVILKNDFEGIQLEQSEIVKAYQAGDKIDYKRMNRSAGKITEMAIRLKANLFPSDPSDKNSENDPEVIEPVEQNKKSIRSLIIDLDNSIGEFVTNKMFENLKVIDTELGHKAASDLEKIINLSGDLWLESNKLKSQ